jgi:hypothetical protein
LDRLAEAAATRSQMNLLAILCELVPDFNHAAGSTDWVDLQRAIGRCDVPETVLKSA